MANVPFTRTDAVVDSYGSKTITDPYRWLEGDTSDVAAAGRVTPEVSAWTDQQNDYTRQTLDSIAARQELERVISPLLQVGAVTAPIVRSGRWFFSRRVGSQSQPVFFWREGARGADRILLDPAAMDPTGLTTVEWISPSHNGRLLAYGTYRSGDENTRLHLISVDTQAALEAPITGKVEAPDWLPDGSGFVYRNLRDADNPYSGQVMFHRLGTAPAADVRLFAQKTPDEDAVLATTWGPHASLSDDGRWLWLGYWRDTQSIDAWIADFDAFRRTGQLIPREVSLGAVGTISGHVAHGQLLLQTTKGAPNGRVVTAPLASPGPENWRDVIAERPDAVIEAVAYGPNVIAVTFLRNASNFIEVFDLTGTSKGVVPLPGIGSAHVAAEPDLTTAYVTFTSFNHPTAIFEVDLERTQALMTLWEQPDVPVDPESVVVEQVWYSSKDGTRVSMFVVRPRDARPTGDVPTIVTGYGGFNISETPQFVPTWFQWFTAGGIIAIPNLRGGGEYGDTWHQGGMRERKQNVFDDFYAAIEWLIAAGWSCPDRLAVSGGSNGGLLTGVTLTQRPDLCRAAVVAVPLLDMLRYQHFLMARYWVPEYGCADDGADFDFLFAYSPYHHVERGRKYPAVLLTAGENDTRVHAMHARKMAAALQAAVAEVPDARPVLLWVDREAGHGQGKPLHLRLRDVVDQRLFLMWQLGMLGQPGQG